MYGELIMCISELPASYIFLPGRPEGMDILFQFFPEFVVCMDKFLRVNQDPDVVYVTESELSAGTEYLKYLTVLMEKLDFTVGGQGSGQEFSKDNPCAQQVVPKFWEINIILPVSPEKIPSLSLPCFLYGS